MLPLILGAAGLFILVSKKPGAQVPDAGGVKASTGGYSPSQPSQLYPWRAITPPRVDNRSQPWYNGPNVAMMAPKPSGMVEAAAALQAGSSVIHSLKDIWGDLSPIPTNDDQSNLMMSESMESVDWVEPDNWDENEMMDVAADQSDAVSDYWEY